MSGCFKGKFATDSAQGTSGGKSLNTCSAAQQRALFHLSCQDAPFLASAIIIEPSENWPRAALRVRSLR